MTFPRVDHRTSPPWGGVPVLLLSLLGQVFGPLPPLPKSLSRLAQREVLIRLFGNEWGVGDLPGGVGIHQK